VENDMTKTNEHQLIVAEGDYVIVHGRFTGTGRPVAWVAADVVRIEAESQSGQPMFGDRFPG